MPDSCSPQSEMLGVRYTQSRGENREKPKEQAHLDDPLQNLAPNSRFAD